MSDNDHTAHPDGYYGTYGGTLGGGGGGGVTPGNDVTWLTGAGAPTNGVAGTGAGTAGPGSIYTDVTNKIEYRNHNTKASPTWVAVIAP